MNAAQYINQTSGKTEYYTPVEIVEAARRTMGSIDLDPASSTKANQIVGATRYFTEADDGLAQVWSGNVWMNHPFGRESNPLWINKLIHAFRNGQVTQACCITFAATSERWFGPLYRFPLCFLTPRTNYRLEDGSLLKGVPKGSVVAYMGPNVRRFGREFDRLGFAILPMSAMGEADIEG